MLLKKKLKKYFLIQLKIRDINFAFSKDSIFNINSTNPRIQKLFYTTHSSKDENVKGEILIGKEEENTKKKNIKTSLPKWDFLGCFFFC